MTELEKEFFKLKKRLRGGRTGSNWEQMKRAESKTGKEKKVENL